LQGNYTRADLLEVSRFWHSGLRIYRGPYVRELHEGGAPLPTLYGSFMGQLFGSHPTGSLADHPVHLRAALVYPFHAAVTQTDIEPYLWVPDLESKALHLFWGDSEKTHSLVIQGVTHWQEIDDSCFAIDCILSEQAPGEGEDKSEVNCFLNYHPDHTIRVGEGRASAFTLISRLLSSHLPSH